MQTITPTELLNTVGLTSNGPVPWGSPVRSTEPGIYVVEWPTVADVAPVDTSAVEGWLTRVPGLRMDGRRPTAAGLSTRLASFWVPEQVIVYVGHTTGQLRKRLQEYYRTDFGARKPHSGGMWLKALRELEQAQI